MKRVLKRAAQVLMVLVLIGAVVGAWAYRKYVVLEPGPEFDRAHVLSIIAQESPVYYRDGVTPMGVFFTPGRVSGQAAKEVGPLVTA